MLTRRGWSLFGAATGLYVGSRVLGLVQLVVLAGIGLLLLAVAAVWVRYHPVHLRATRHLRERLQVGVDGASTSSWNRPPARMPTLSVSDAFDRGRRSARFLLTRSSRAKCATATPTDQRGRFEIGPLRPRSATRSVSRAAPGVPHRRGHRFPRPRHHGAARDRQRQPTATCPARQADPGGEFLNLRDYEPGDDLRRCTGARPRSRA
jgi:uncharacterized protein (DUF58 family)